MKNAIYILIVCWFSVYSQEQIEATLINKTAFQADAVVDVTNFNTTFYILNNVLLKHNEDEPKENDLGYNNFQLGNITSVNTFNPLKINVFYKDFNTVVVLDNRLAEIFKIDFNSLADYKNISHVTTGSDNTLWVFNENTQQLELFDYKTNTTRAKTLPIKHPVLAMKSNYNYCWLLTEAYIYKYDYFGNLLNKAKNEGFTAMALKDEDLVLKKNKALFYLKKQTENPIPIALPNLLINGFFATNETLYIYNLETLFEYQLKIN